MRPESVEGEKEEEGRKKRKKKKREGKKALGSAPSLPPSNQNFENLITCTSSLVQIECK